MGEKRSLTLLVRELIDQLTDEEFAALTDEQLEALLDKRLIGKLTPAQLAWLRGLRR